MNPKQSKNPSLDLHEWLAIAVVIGLLFTITSATWLRRYSLARHSSHKSVKDFTIPIYVQGAVEHPGSYNFSVTSTVKDALDRAIPLPDSDLRRIDLAKKLRPGQVIRIPKKQMIQVKIEGAVERPGVLEIPRGTKLKDLKKYVTATAEADFEKLPPNRVVKANSTVYIPSKNLDLIPQNNTKEQKY